MAQADTIINNTTNININVRAVPSRVVIMRGEPSTSASLPPPPSSFPYEQSELIPYLPPHCAQLYESQLYGRQRHESYAAANGVRREFSQQCSDAMQDARQAIYKDKLKQYYAKQDKRSEASNALAQSSRTKAQCDELLRILAAKRRQMDAMTDGERADHDRSEAAYAARCKVGTAP